MKIIQQYLYLHLVSGKRRNTREPFVTTQGHTVAGVIDEKLRGAKDILEGRVTELGTLPLYSTRSMPKKTL